MPLVAAKEASSVIAYDVLYAQVVCGAGRLTLPLLPS
jgi:hypothetical protein